MGQMRQKTSILHIFCMGSHNDVFCIASGNDSSLQNSVSRSLLSQPKTANLGLNIDAQMEQVQTGSVSP